MRGRMSAAALEALLTYEWPGNVRELERVIERAITLAEGDEIQLNDLPPALNERYSIVQPATEGGESMRASGAALVATQPFVTSSAITSVQ
jgi:DNA-binding NtrC family response regulator